MKIAVIGYGGMGRHHCALMRESKALEPAGAYDISAERLELARQDGLKAYNSPQELYDDRDIEAVLIATPNDSHCGYAVAAAKAGKHILCEKPVCLSLAEFDAMESAAKAAGVLFSVHQNRRWDRDYLIAGKILRDNVLGKIYRIESTVAAGNGIPGDWRKLKEKGGGMMLDWGVHLLDQILLLPLPSPTRKSCRLTHVKNDEVDDGFVMTLGYENGADVRITVDTNCFIPQPRWRIYGENGTAEITDWACEGSIVLADESKLNAPKAIIAGNGYTKTMAQRSKGSTVTLDLPQVQEEKHVFYKNFTAAARGECESFIKPAEVRRVLEMMLEFIERDNR